MSEHRAETLVSRLEEMAGFLDRHDAVTLRRPTIEGTTKLLREAADALSAAQRLREALAKARTFIEYARYELEPGLAQFGDQFPKQEDAYKVMALIDAALLADRSTP